MGISSSSLHDQIASILGFALRFRLSQLASHLFELFHAGQIVHIFQPEAEEKLLGGFVEDGPANHRLSAAVVISLRLTRLPSTPPESTPRISLTSGAVTGCL